MVGWVSGVQWAFVSNNLKELPHDLVRILFRLDLTLHMIQDLIVGEDLIVPVSMVVGDKELDVFRTFTHEYIVNFALKDLLQDPCTETLALFIDRGQVSAMEEFVRVERLEDRTLGLIAFDIDTVVIK